MIDGSIQSPDMSSFNHYAYGAVIDWVYEEAAGIKPMEECPGFEEVIIEPKPDRRLKWLEAVIDTRKGRVSSNWIYEEGGYCYEIETPVVAEIIIGMEHYHVKEGSYIFTSRY